MRVFLAVAVLALPSPAWSQEAVKLLDRPKLSPRLGQWEVQFSASAEQAFVDGSETDGDLDLFDSQDEGEYALGMKLRRSLPRYVDFSIAPALVVNPHMFDTQEEASSWSLRFRVERKIDITDAEVDNQRREKQDYILPFATYKIGQAYDGIFERGGSDSQEVGVGLKITNILGYLCRAGQNRPHCTGGPGTQYAVTVSYSAFEFEVDSKDRQGPKIAAEWSRPVTNFYGVWVDASAERRTFDNLLSDDGVRGADAGHYSIAAGIDLSGWLHARYRGLDNVGLKLGVRWVGTDANREDLDRNEIAIIPTLSWER